MAAGVVHVFEVVDVDQQKREVLLLAACPLGFRLQPVLEVASVEQASYGSTVANWVKS